MTTATETKNSTKQVELPSSTEKSSKRRNPVLERLDAIRDTVDFALSDDSVRAKLNDVEFTEEILHEGHRLCREAAVLTVWQSVLFRRQFADARELEHLQARVHHAYQPVLRLARMVFGEDPELSRKLILRGRRSDSLSGQIRRMSAFYGRILTEETLIARLESYGCTQEELMHGNSSLRELTDTLSTGEQRKAALERATRKRNAALRRAYEWLDMFHAIARTVFVGSPDVLSRLNIHSEQK